MSLECVLVFLLVCEWLGWFAGVGGRVVGRWGGGFLFFVGVRRCVVIMRGGLFLFAGGGTGVCEHARSSLALCWVQVCGTASRRPLAPCWGADVFVLMRGGLWLLAGVQMCVRM